MTRNYPSKGGSTEQSSVESGQPPSYIAATATDSFPPRYTDVEDSHVRDSNGKSIALTEHTVKTPDLEVLDEPESYHQNPSPACKKSRRFWSITFVVFALLVGIRLMIPPVVASLPHRHVDPPINEKPIPLPNSPPSKPPSTASRKTYIEQTSSSVGGTYSLLDLLYISTTSGSINVAVTPEAADPTVPKPASLIARSSSGSVNANLPINPGFGRVIPRRDYRTEISSRSGSISGSYLFGSLADFQTRSGTISIAALPVFAQGERATIKTESQSGSHSVDIKSPAYGRGNPIGTWTSSHRAQSGTLNLRYPREWEGEVRVTTSSGSITVVAEGLEVLESRRGWFRGVKGSGGSVLTVEGGSGSVNLAIG